MPDAKPIYKIIITGAFWSGKSTFIKTLTDPFEWATRGDAQILGVRGGQIELEDVAFHFYVTPNSRRFDFMWETMVENVLGFIVMVDSSKPETFREAYSILEIFRVYTELPFVVAASFQDKADAWDAEAMHIALHLDTKIPIIPCIGTDKASVNNVLLALCDEILKDIAALEDDIV